jgi:hypothetical protein
MRWRANQDLLVEFGLWLTLAVGAFFLTFDFDQPLDVYRFGAANWPRVLILALAVGAGAVRLNVVCASVDGRQ